MKTLLSVLSSLSALYLSSFRLHALFTILCSCFESPSFASVSFPAPSLDLLPSLASLIVVHPSPRRSRRPPRSGSARRGRRGKQCTSRSPSWCCRPESVRKKERERERGTREKTGRETQKEKGEERRGEERREREREEEETGERTAYNPWQTRPNHEGECNRSQESNTQEIRERERERENKRESVCVCLHSLTFPSP